MISLKINWKIRFKQKQFIIALFAAVLLLVQQVGNIFGFEVSEALSDQVAGIFNTVLGILILLGVIVDPTTDGLEDSRQALGYRKPKSDSDYI